VKALVGHERLDAAEEHRAVVIARYIVPELCRERKRCERSVLTCELPVRM
jgi:hypothetical protein